MEPEAVKPEADEYTSDAYNKYLTAEVFLPLGGVDTKSRVTQHKRDASGL